MSDQMTIWVSEYSFQQKCFHIHTLAEALIQNARAIETGSPADYIPFAISTDRDTASAQCQKMRERLERKEGDPG